MRTRQAVRAICLNRPLVSLGQAWLVAAFVALAPAGVAMAQWPQFRGPTGEGLSDAKNLPATWSEKENIRWSCPIPGLGWSSPVIDRGKIWMTTATDEGKSLRAVCVDQESGKLLHDVEVFYNEKPAPVNEKNSYASPTPVAEDGKVYVYFGTSGAACLDESGKIVWTNRNHPLDHKEGPGSSPILYRDLLIFNCDGMDVQYVLALDKKTGREVWKANRTGELPTNPDMRKAYSTPLVIQVNGKDQLVSPGASRVVAYDPADGKEIWRVNYTGFSNVPRPVHGHGLVIVSTGYTNPKLIAIREGGTGDITKSHVVWEFPKQAPANSSPIIVGDGLYMASDRGVATCLDVKTGKVRWTDRLGGNYSAAPVFADGKLYFCSEQGPTSVLAPGPKFDRLAVNILPGRILASPALIDGAIFLRTDTHLYRIQASK